MIDKGLNVNQRCKHTSLHYVIIIETINNNMLGFKLRSIGNNPVQGYHGSHGPHGKL